MQPRHGHQSSEAGSNPPLYTPEGELNQYSNEPPTPTRGVRAGVGMVLAQGADGTMYVQRLCPGSSGHENLLPGDVLMGIDGFTVSQLSAGDVAGLLLGPAGSFTEVTVRRVYSDNSVEDLMFDLERKKTDPVSAKYAPEASSTLNHTHMRAFTTTYSLYTH